MNPPTHTKKKNGHYFMLTILHIADVWFFSSYPKADSVLQIWVRVEVQETQS